MELSAVLLARAFLFIETHDLNPRGTAFYPDLIRALVDRYRFQKFPQRIEDLDENKGVEFLLGRSGNTTIEKLVIYQTGLSLDTTASTQESEAILEAALMWASEQLGLSYRPGMVRRKAYVSQVTFYTRAPMLAANPILTDFAQRISRAVSENLQLEYSYAPSALMIGLDPEAQRVPSSPFTLEYRVGTAFSDGKYFSAAPLQTDVHLRLLEEYERGMLDRAQR